MNFPRWEEDVAISVAEVGANGALTPYPDRSWNAFRNADAAAAKPGASFVCVQSVTVDAQDRLWVLDPAAPGLAFEVQGGPKLVCIDLATNAVKRVYRFGPDVAPAGQLPQRPPLHRRRQPCGDDQLRRARLPPYLRRRDRRRAPRAGRASEHAVRETT